MSQITRASNNPTQSSLGKDSGVTGCLGSLVILTLIGSVFFGGGVLLRVGQWHFQLGNPAETDKTIANYLVDLESKAKIADDAVQRFNNQLNQGKCQEAYQQTSEAFKSDTSQSNFLNLCTGLKIQLGSIESIKRTDWWGQPAEKGENYILTRYETKLSKSTALQSFTWLIKDGRAQLVNIQIFPIKAADYLNLILSKVPSTLSNKSKSNIKS